MAWVTHDGKWSSASNESSHRRVTLADLLAYRADMVARRRAVLDQMSRDADELGFYE